jgi:hypothetical protein
MTEIGKPIRKIVVEPEPLKTTEPPAKEPVKDPAELPEKVPA